MDDITYKIGELIEIARKKILVKVNSVMVETYYEIGKNIVEYEQKGNIRAEYGKNLIRSLSKKLTLKYGKGFGESNLHNMKKFYLEIPKVQTASGKLNWSHITILLRIEDQLKRNFYIKEIELQNWSVRELKRQINSALFERYALSKNKMEILNLAVTGQIIENSKDLIKDPYILEFLDLEEKSNYTEKELEQKIMDNLQKFILELGKGAVTTFHFVRYYFY